MPNPLSALRQRDALDRLSDPIGYNFGARRITVSTVGLVPMIRRFAAEKRQINLAISLHAANDELRASLLPVDRKYPLAELISACKDYISTTNRRLTFEWALIQDVNDLPEHARELGGLLRGMLCHVNVIPLNPTRKYSGRATTHQRAETFKAELEKLVEESGADGYICKPFTNQGIVNSVRKVLK